MRKDPSLANYRQAFNAFIEKAKKDPTKNYLQIQSFAGHGYHVAGFQQVPTPYYDPETKGYMMIPVESIVRINITGVSNAYCLVLFACCREVKKLSKFEVKKLA
jgi:hypothetical protein